MIQVSRMFFRDIINLSVIQGIEELDEYVVEKQFQLAKINTVEGLLKHTKRVKPIIAIGKVCYHRVRGFSRVLNLL